MGKEHTTSGKATLGQTPDSAGSNYCMCPVKALSALLEKFNLKTSQPLLVLDDYQLLTQSHLRSHLATFLRTMGLPLEGHGFHTFRRSAATIAYDANASLTAIKTHGLWHT